MIKICREDLFKLVEHIKKNSRSVTLNVNVEGPQVTFSFEDIDHKYAIITIYDTATLSRATLTRAETL